MGAIACNGVLAASFPVAALHPASYPDFVFNVVQTLLAAGYVRKGSSDGTTFDNTGVGNNWPDSAHVNHANSWIRLQAPDGSFEKIFQFTPNSIRIKYTSGSTFTGGSPSATQVPAAASGLEALMVGAGTDAPPTYWPRIPTVSNTHNMYVYCDGTTAPFPWYAVCYPSGGSSTLDGAWLWDGINFTEPSDGDLTAAYFSGGTGALTKNELVTNNAGIGSAAAAGVITGWMYYELPGSRLYCATPALDLTTGSKSLVNGGLGVSPRTSKESTLPIFLARDNSVVTPGWRGALKSVRWACTSHTTPNTSQVTAANDRQIAAHCALVWPAAAGAWV